MSIPAGKDAAEWGLGRGQGPALPAASFMPGSCPAGADVGTGDPAECHHAGPVTGTGRGGRWRRDRGCGEGEGLHPA